MPNNSQKSSNVETIDAAKQPIPPVELRDRLFTMVVNDLLGPAGGPEEEVDEQYVSDRYLVGMLAPKRNSDVADLFDELALGGKGTDEDGKADISAPQMES